MSTAERFINSFSYPDRFPSSPRFAFEESAPSGAGEAAPATAPVSAPSSAPAGAPSGAPDPTPAGAPSSADPFAGFDSAYGDVGGDDVIEIPPEAPGTEPGAPGEAPPAPAPEAPPAAPPPVVPQGDPPPAATAAPTAGTPGASPTDQLSAVIEGFKTHQKELSAHAAQTLFKLSEEDATALATNAEEVIPRLMGQVYNQSIAAAGNLIRTFVPQLIEAAVTQINTKAERSKEAITEFYKANPDLNEKDHSAFVAKWAKAFRTMNPTAPRSEAIAFVARAIRSELGLTPLAPNGAKPGARAAFAPARPGGHQPPPAAEHDPYAGIGMEFDS